MTAATNALLRGAPPPTVLTTPGADRRIAAGDKNSLEGFLMYGDVSVERPQR